MTPAEIIARLERHISRDDSGCWVWTGAVQSSGYGSIGWDGKTYLAHRASYEAYHGPIPAGLQVDHLCCVKLCVNPEHLEAVTGLVNMQRRNGRVDECKRNHPLSGDNLLITKSGKRQCRECGRQRVREAYARRKGDAPVRAYTRRMRAANSPTK